MKSHDNSEIKYLIISVPIVIDFKGIKLLKIASILLLTMSAV